MDSSSNEVLYRQIFCQLYGEDFIGPPPLPVLASLVNVDDANIRFEWLARTPLWGRIMQYDEKEQIFQAILTPFVAPQLDQLVESLEQTQNKALTEIADLSDRLLMLLENVEHPGEYPPGISDIAANSDICAQLSALRAKATSCKWPSTVFQPSQSGAAMKEKEKIYLIEPKGKKHKNCRLWVIDGKEYAEITTFYRPVDWGHEQLITTTIGSSQYRLYISSSAGDIRSVFPPAKVEAPTLAVARLFPKSKNPELIYLRRVVKLLSNTTFNIHAAEAETLLETLFDAFPHRSQIDRILRTANT